MTTTGWLGVRRVSICHEKDPVCDSILDKDESAHANYFKPGVKLVPGTGMGASETDEVDFMAKALATSVRVARESYSGHAPTSAAKDTVFAIDTTGSMQPYINNVRHKPGGRLRIESSPRMVAHGCLLWNIATTETLLWLGLLCH